MSLPTEPASLPSARAGSRPWRDGRLLLVSLAVASGFGLVESVKALIGAWIRGMHVPAWIAFAQNMPWWLFWALLVPVIARLVDRFPLSGPRRGRALLWHSLAAVVLSLVHLVASALALFPFVINRAAVQSPWTLALSLFQGYFLLDLVSYGAIVGAVHALGYYGSLRDRELEAATLRARTAELEGAVARARLAALRMELNPHFLFNALNSIAGLIRRGESTGAVAMVASLGDLLRETLSLGSAPRVPLSDELRLVRLYLRIEAVRFHDRLAVSLDVEPEAETCLVPTLILQPLVENAVKHGVARDPAGGRILVRGVIEDGRLVLEVENRPVGAVPTPLPARTEGRGLANTRARLAQLYDGQGYLGLEDLADGGCRVTLRFPAEPQPLAVA